MQRKLGLARRSYVESLEGRHMLAAVSVVASQDNSLYEDSQGVLSNGAGDYLFAGRTKQSAGRSLRRALVQFDIAGAVPPGFHQAAGTAAVQVGGGT